MANRGWKEVAAAGICALLGTAAAAGQPAMPSVVGSVQMHVVAAGETVTAIGARYGVDVRVILADNFLTARDRLAVGRRLLIDNRHIIPAAAEPGVVVVNLPQRMLFHLDADGLTAFPAAVGSRGWPTPVGVFSVMTREENPTWDVPESIREEARRAGRELPATVPPGPANPLGRFWLGLSAGSVGIHGTNAPSSIYRTATHGCIRLHPDDIARLFARVAVGTVVHVIYEPVLVALADDEVFIEVHPDAYRRAPAARAAAVARVDTAGLGDRIDWARAEAALAAADGIARNVTRMPGP